MKFLNFLSGLLGKIKVWDETTQSYKDMERSEYLDAAGFPWLESLLSALEKIVGPILILVAAVGVIYAIYLGVLLAKAENAEKREEAKKRIINVVIAIAITAVLIFLMYLFSNNVQWFVKLGNTGSGSSESGGEGAIRLLQMMR